MQPADALALEILAEHADVVEMIAHVYQVPRHERPDLRQLVAIAILQACRDGKLQGEQPDRVRNYVNTVASNKAKDLYHQRQKVMAWPLHGPHVDHLYMGSEAHQLQAIEVSEALAASQHLAPEQRYAIAMAAAGWTPEELNTLHERPARNSTFRRNLHSARANLRKRLNIRP